MSKLTARPPESWPKLRKSENIKKKRKNAGFIDFSSSNMYFRSADAANNLNARPQIRIRVTRRAYIPKIYKLEE